MKLLSCYIVLFKEITYKHVFYQLAILWEYPHIDLYETYFVPAFFSFWLLPLTTELTLNVKNVQQIDMKFKFSTSPLKFPVVCQSIYEYSAPGAIQISHELSFCQISMAAVYCQSLAPSHITNFQLLLSICTLTAFCYLTVKIHIFFYWYEI